MTRHHPDLGRSGSGHEHRPLSRVNKTRLVQGVITLAATAGIAFGAANAANAEIVTGVLPLGECQAHAAAWSAQSAPEQTVASGYGYRCVRSAQWPNKGVVERYMYNT